MAQSYRPVEKSAPLPTLPDLAQLLKAVNPGLDSPQSPSLSSPREAVEQVTPNQEQTSPIPVSWEEVLFSPVTTEQGYSTLGPILAESIQKITLAVLAGNTQSLAQLAASVISRNPHLFRESPQGISPADLETLGDSLEKSLDKKLKTAVQGLATPRFLEIPPRPPLALGKILGPQHSRFPRLLSLVQALTPRQVMLIGPSGSGKTHAAQALAQALDLPYFSLGACMLPSDLIGYMDATGNYHGTEFTRAFISGGVCILDEIDSYSERASLALNEALSNGTASFGGTRYSRHPDCIVLAGANTWGTGATLDFSGRARMDTALLNRFPAKLLWEYDSDLESALTSPKIAQGAAQLRTRAETLGLKINFTPRHTQAISQLVSAGESLDSALETILDSSIPADHRKSLVTAFLR